ncbi:tRNA preQ1(34) S-adenosylmethionine ribosyltransferase-isomerase QueA [Granulicella tundricola]|uniref:S-adenosylmethionine:tRNA ribosyltransferase-isomerase n=1 Tax=Granulicella tundricola (strain ATCC BAA-1859 / DSM 23138 / MP5ACTX9) TaxID=1198114 RepID=E8X0D6_GRATM|nr:tRNA preQ1(34) S-adenosylmethionine ribosyltransferase-isomerase QueA [Granulicella tundricola]ADW67800.1 S-adenosylmethionine/tRNA-ribosyltransferase-isomerase [Granulicella tundricola MP5ACTX9]
MLVSDFDYELPEELIAQTPPETRGASRMLRMDRASGALVDDSFASLPECLKAGDLLILNDTRVIPARLFGVRAGLHTQHNSPAPTGRIEVLLTSQISADDEGSTWETLVRPARKVQPGETLHFYDAERPSAPALTAEVLAAGEFGERTLRLIPADPQEPLTAILERIGHLPLPPYIYRPDEAPNTTADRERYQTVFAQPAGSAAAPTAGLHFTPEILAALKARGVEVQTLTLHVGLGTFQPVRAERTEDIRLHAEPYTLPAATAEAIQRAQAEGRRIVAVGTTVTRTLEHCAAIGNLAPHSGTTSLFLSPGHEFRVVGGLLTNFHLPQSTLVMLVSAFAGREATLAAYAHAVRERYRFFSYGDCMLIV